MKYLQRYCSVLCVLVLLFAIFSINVSAEESTESDTSTEPIYKLDINYFDNYPRKFIGQEIVILDRPGNEYQNNVSSIQNANLVDPSINADYVQGYEIYTSRTDNMPIIKSGETFNFTLTGIQMWTYMYTTNSDEHYKAFDSFYIRVLRSDGTYKTLDSKYIKHTFNANSKMQSFSIVDYTADFDIQTVHVQLRWKPVTRIGLDYKERFIPRYKVYDLRDTVQLKIVPKTEGLLSGLIGWVTNIFNSITEGFNNIGQGFSNVVGEISDLFSSVSNGFSNIGTWFSELPSKLWSVISEGLKNLFVPDEEYMTDYSDRWDELLSSRFGAIYQVGTIITNFAERIQVSDKTNTITIPEVSLNSAGIPFSFGGYNVQIVPNGFNFIVETLKIIVSIVCTFMFVNGLRKRYDEVMGVEQ